MRSLNGSQWRASRVARESFVIHDYPKSPKSERATTGYGLATTLRNLEKTCGWRVRTRAKSTRSPFTAQAFPNYMRLRLLTWQAGMMSGACVSICRCSCMECGGAPPPLSLGKRRRGYGEHVPMLVPRRGLGRGLRGRLLEAGEDGLGLLEHDGAEDQPNGTEEHDATD